MIARTGLLILLTLSALKADGQRRKPKDPAVLADTLMAREQFKQAIPMLTKLMDDPDPDKSITYRNKRAICYYFTGQFDQARSDLSAVLTSDPGAIRAWILMAYVEQERSNSKGMLTALNQVILQLPEETEFLYWRARLLTQEGRHAEAQSDLESLRKLGAESSSLELLAAMNAFGLHGLATALPHFDKAIELEPADATLYLYAGSFCLDEERFELARSYFDAGLTQQPDNLDLMMYKGYTLVEMKQVEEGCRLLRRVFYSGHEDAGDYLNEYCFHYGR